MGQMTRWAVLVAPFLSGCVPDQPVRTPLDALLVEGDTCEVEPEEVMALRLRRLRKVEMHEELHHSERADQGGASTNAGEVGEWHRGAGNGLPAIPRSRPLADPSATVAPKQGKRRRTDVEKRFDLKMVVLKHALRKKR